MNQWATSLGGNLLGSYNAVNPVTGTAHEVVTPAKAANTSPVNALPATQCSFNRPDGLSEGTSALADSVGPPYALIPGEATAQVTLPANGPQANCVDIARSTVGPSAADVKPLSGPLLYIPFAMDGVTASVGPSAAIPASGSDLPAGCSAASGASSPCVATPASNLAALSSTGFSLSGLEAMYASGDDAVADGASGSSTCYAPANGPDLTTMLPPGVTCASTVPVDLYVPPFGSGTLIFWAQQLGFSALSVPPWVYQAIQPDGGQTVSQFVGQPVQEDDGTAVTADPNGLFPFVISQYIGQHNGHTAGFHGAQLLPVSGFAPEVSGKLDSSFPAQLLREVYNVVGYDRVVNTGDGNYDATLAALLVSTSALNSAKSLLCKQQTLIQFYGLTVITPAAPSPAGLGGQAGGHYCGQVDASNLRATLSGYNVGVTTAVSIPVGSDPGGIAADPATHTVYVANQGSGTVSVINEATNAVTATIPVGSHPQALAIDPATQTVWVANNGDGTVSVISEATDTVVQTVNVDTGGSGGLPDSVVADAATHTVYVGLSPGSILAVNDSSYAAAQCYTTGGTSHVSVSAVNPATSTLFAIASDAQSVLQISTSTCAQTASLGGQGLPSDAVIENSAASGYPGYLYVSSSGGPVAVYANVNAPPIVSSGTLSTPAGYTVSAVTVNATTDTASVALIPSSGSGSGLVEVISGASTPAPQAIATVIVGNNPGGITVDPQEGGMVFVANSGSNTVTAISE
jgi:YVTN family beta-propeller protein